MNTIINNNERKFLIQNQGFGNSKDIFCNLRDIKKVISTSFDKNEEYIIFEYWNRKLKRVSKKRLAEYFEANQIDIKNNIFTIDIQAKEWFDKVNGNSYHAGEVTVNFGRENEKTLNFCLTYGYGEHYKQTAYKVLIEANLLPKLEHTDLYNYIKSNGIEVRANITTNCKKSELMQYK